MTKVSGTQARYLVWIESVDELRMLSDLFDYSFDTPIFAMQTLGELVMLRSPLYVASYQRATGISRECSLMLGGEAAKVVRKAVSNLKKKDKMFTLCELFIEIDGVDRIKDPLKVLEKVEKEMGYGNWWEWPKENVNS